MRKLLSGLALCALAGGANAALVYGSTEVFDTSTGLDWSFLRFTGGAPYSVITETRSDGKRLATGSELLTFFADAGISPLSGVYTLPGGPPAGFDDLANRWAGGVRSYQGQSSVSQFIFASDVPGSVGTGAIGGGVVGINQFSYGANISPQPIAYDVGRFITSGVVLVTLAVPEPSTYLLMALGLAALAIRKRSTS